MLTWRIIAGVVSVLAIWVILWDAFEVIILPRRVTRDVRFARCSGYTPPLLIVLLESVYSVSTFVAQDRQRSEYVGTSLFNASRVARWGAACS